mmetsp:Transcript_43971/g.93578  ORF Transcript_43971/g.93578 Transcript_43971/m.93578 type:complete len:93 (+) Transcript_43971:308-586(+)
MEPGTEFEVEAIVGKKQSEGTNVDWCRGRRKGMWLYRIIWKGFLPEAATWEATSDINEELLLEYEAGLEAEAELEAEEEAELAEDEENEGGD